MFKVHQLVDADVTFVLTNGGHNAGIVSEPGHAGRHYQMHTTARNDKRPTPDDWAATAAPCQGSWWEAWSGWMQQHGSGEKVDARSDVFSLGIVLHQCLTGVRLFYADNLQEELIAPLKKQAQPPSVLACSSGISSPKPRVTTTPTAFSTSSPPRSTS